MGRDEETGVDEVGDSEREGIESGVAHSAHEHRGLERVMRGGRRESGTSTEYGGIRETGGNREIKR